MPNPAQFLELPDLRTNQSEFNFNWDNKLTCKMAILTPIMCKEVIAGDYWRGSCDVFMRFETPLIAPVMHKVNLFTHFFYVPKRILWNASAEDSFEMFMTGGREGTKKPIPPFFTLKNTYIDELGATSSLLDYLNVNIQQLANGTLIEDLEFSQLPFRAYQAICDEFYRNKNLQDSYFNEIRGFHGGQIVSPLSGFTEDNVEHLYGEIFALRTRLWEDDYFTSALPSPERGEPINIPFITAGDLNVHTITGQKKAGLWKRSDNDALSVALGAPVGPALVTGATSAFQISQDSVDIGGESVLTDVSFNAISSPTYYYDPNGTLHTTVNSIRNQATMRDLRVASLAERFQEIAMNTIPDYRHLVNAMFDVQIPDFRLQLPEFVGGGRQAVTFSEVTQTSADTILNAGTAKESYSPQGSLAGHGVSVPQAASNRHSFEFYAPEPGFVIGIMSIMPKTAYGQGLPKMYSRYDRFDEYWPLFETLPFQEIKNKELYVSGEKSVDDATFGYAPRFSEFRWFDDEIHGDLKTNLNYWTMARLFSETPSLNVDFVTADPTTRIYNIDDDVQPLAEQIDKLVCLCDFNVTIRRNMSKYIKI